MRDGASRRRFHVSPRIKKLIAAAVIAPGLAAYALGAIVVADLLPDFWLVDLLYFIVAGVAWALPAGLLMTWAGREPSRNGTPPET